MEQKGAKLIGKGFLACFFCLPRLKLTALQLPKVLLTDAGVTVGADSPLPGAFSQVIEVSLSCIKNYP